MNLTSGALVVSSTTLSGAVIDLLFTDGQTTANGLTTAQVSSYNFANVSASTYLHADTQSTTRTAVNLSFTTSDDLLIDSVRSNFGDVRLTAGGAIVALSSSNAAEVTGNNPTLIATSTIGAGNALNVDSAHSASGTVTATAGGTIVLHEVAGDLSNSSRSSRPPATSSLPLPVKSLTVGRASNAPAVNVGTTTGRGFVGRRKDRRRLRYLQPASPSSRRQPARALQQHYHGRSSLDWRRGCSSAWPVPRFTWSRPALMVSQSILSAGAVAVRVESYGSRQDQGSEHQRLGDADGNGRCDAGCRQPGVGERSHRPGRHQQHGRAGSTIDVSGVIAATRQITTGGRRHDQPLQVAVNVPLSVRLRRLNNSLYIPGTAGDGVFLVNGSTVTLSGVETVTYSSIRRRLPAGDDLFIVTGSSGTWRRWGSGSDTLDLRANGSSNTRSCSGRHQRSQQRLRHRQHRRRRRYRGNPVRRSAIT